MCRSGGGSVYIQLQEIGGSTAAAIYQGVDVVHPCELWELCCWGFAVLYYTVCLIFSLPPFLCISILSFYVYPPATGTFIWGLSEQPQGSEYSQ